MQFEIDETNLLKYALSGLSSRMIKLRLRTIKLWPKILSLRLKLQNWKINNRKTN